MQDIVFAKDNEKEFLKLAKRLGYDNLAIIGKDAFLAKNSNEVSRQKKNFDYIIAEGKPWAFQDKRVDIIYNLEASKDKDFLHHRRGMNQVMAKQARDHKTAVAFNFNLLLGNNRDVVVGRMKQNVKLCRKYNVKMIMASFATTPWEMRNPRDLQALGITVGMHPKEAKAATLW